MYKRLALVLALCCSAAQQLTYAEGSFIARVGQSGEFLEMEDQRTGQIVKDYLPLYRAGNVRYFSAGVGMEERQAEYPHFSLKVVFTAGGKPYLTGVDVTIQPEKEGASIIISRDRIEGPWLFIDLPAGTYDISAMYGDQKQTLKGIKVVAGRQKTVQLQWPADIGSMVKVPNE
jgi:hypothetical protein